MADAAQARLVIMRWTLPSTVKITLQRWSRFLVECISGGFPFSAVRNLKESYSLLTWNGTCDVTSLLCGESNGSRRITEGGVS